MTDTEVTTPIQEAIQELDLMMVELSRTALGDYVKLDDVHDMLLDLRLTLNTSPVLAS